MRALLIASLLFSSQLPAQLNKDLGAPSKFRGVSAPDTQVTSALKEVLSTTSTNAIKMTSVENGFFGNTSIKIVMPENMLAMEQSLRMAGQGLVMADFELSMNRAAEMASPAIEPLLSKAIASLKFTDPRGVLNGGRTATTDYLATASSAELVKALRPTVEAAMSRTGVNTNYSALFVQMKGLTLGQAPEFDIAAYVTKRTLDGIFTMMGAEEAKIRNNSDAPLSPLVKEVFTKQ